MRNTDIININSIIEGQKTDSLLTLQRAVLKRKNAGDVLHVKRGRRQLVKRLVHFILKGHFLLV